MRPSLKVHVENDVARLVHDDVTRLAFGMVPSILTEAKCRDEPDVREAIMWMCFIDKTADILGQWTQENSARIVEHVRSIGVAEGRPLPMSLADFRAVLAAVWSWRPQEHARPRVPQLVVSAMEAFVLSLLAK